MTNQSDKPGGKVPSGSIKNPEREIEHPAPMPANQQGQGGKGKDSDPAGQQGGQPQR
jgi:hypothetical protein